MNSKNFLVWSTNQMKCSPSYPRRRECLTYSTKKIMLQEPIRRTLESQLSPPPSALSLMTRTEDWCQQSEGYVNIGINSQSLMKNQ